MGKRGPPPKPTAMKILEGIPGHRPLPEGEVLPPLADAEDPPEWLKGQGLAIWHQLAKTLTNLGLLTKNDTMAFARYCDLLAKWIVAKEWIDNHGMTFPVLNKKGQIVEIKKFPQVGEYRMIAAELLRYENQFGMTPSARSRINVPAAGGRWGGATLPPPGTDLDDDDRMFDD